MKTLAEALGETSHLSPLAKKLRRLGISTPEQWKQLAVLRGCAYYQQEHVTVVDPGKNLVSNLELAVALLLGDTPYDLTAIRMAGQLLSEESDVDAIIRLAQKERVSRRIRYIADKGSEVEPENPLWSGLCENLQEHSYPPGRLPHVDRFTVDVGGGREALGKPRQTQWLKLVKPRVTPLSE